MSTGKFSRLLVEVLVSNTPTFNTYDEDITDTLSLSDTVTELHSWTLIVSSALSLTDQAFEAGNLLISASNSLSLSDLATGGRAIAVSVSSVLSLTDIVQRHIDLLTSNQMTIVDAVDTNQKLVSASSILALADVALGGIQNLSCSSVLTLSDMTKLSDTFTQSASSVLVLTDSATPGLYNLFASNALSLTEPEVFGDLGNIWTKNASNDVGLSDSVTLGNAVYSRSLPAEIDIVQGLTKYLQLTDTVSISAPRVVAAADTLAMLDFVELAGGAIWNRSVSDFAGIFDHIAQVNEQSVSNVLDLTDEGDVSYSLSTFISFSDLADVSKAHTTSNDLGISDTVFVQGTYSRDIVDTVSMQQSVAYIRIQEGTLCTYTPFIGAGVPGDPPPPSATPPVLGYGRLTLTYPPDIPTSTVTLRNPDWGNTDTLASDRINRVSRGGTLIIFNDPMWPTQQTLQLAVLALTEAQVSELLTFFKATLGLLIRLADWEGRSWLGIITTPDATVTRNRDCSHNVTFEFEGEIV